MAATGNVVAKRSSTSRAAYTFHGIPLIEGGTVRAASVTFIEAFVHADLLHCCRPLAAKISGALANAG